MRPSTATSRKTSRVKSSSSNRRRKGSKDDSTFADVLKGKRAENARENVSPGLKTIKALNIEKEPKLIENRARMNSRHKIRQGVVKMSRAKKEEGAESFSLLTTYRY